MPQVIIYDPTSAPVANRVLRYQRSVDAAPYIGREDVIIYTTDGDPPDVAALIAASIPMSLWKVDAGTTVELTAADKLLIEETNAAAAIEAENAAVDVSRIANLETKSAAAIINTEKLEPII